MKTIILFATCLALGTTLNAQVTDVDEIVIRRIADNIIDNTSLTFTSTDGRQTFNTTKDIPDNVEARLKSTYGEWHYTNGVLNMAMINLSNFTGDKKYFDDAAHQVFNFSKYLWDETRDLYYNCYYSDLGRNGVAHWGRCNGWIMMAKVHLLNFMPADHPDRQAVIKDLERQIVGISKYQDADGLWHQLLDKNDSYSESSCTAMFVYCIARAVNQGWIDKR